MMEKRTLRGFKRIAMVLSAGAMIVPLVGCRAKTIFDEKDVRQTIDEYSSNYDNGTLQNGTELYKYVDELYSKYEKRAKKSFVPVLEPDNTGFVGPAVHGPVDVVKIKTNKEPIIATRDDNNTYTIYLQNKDEGKISAYTYYSDGSYSLFVNDQKGILKAKFDKNGLIQSKENNDKNAEHTYYEYQDGNLAAYSLYIPGKGIQEKRNTDGSYTLYKYNGRYEEYIPKEYERLEFNYDKDNSLKNIDAYRQDTYESEKNYASAEHYSAAECMPHTENIHAIYQPNGDSFTYIKFYDLKGNYLGDKKISEKYKDTIDSVQETTVDGKKTTIISRYDYNVADPEWSFHTLNKEKSMGTIVYEKVNDTVTVNMKDGIIYKYTAENDTIREYGHHGFGIGYRENCPAGLFKGAYKVLDDGVMHYNQDGSKKYFENEYQEKLQYFDEIGKAEYTSIRDKNHKEGFVLTEYYGDENGVVSNIVNSSNDEVTVNANEQEIILGPGGKVSFYENAQVKEYKNASDKSNTINVQDVSYEVEAHGSISFYENGKIADIKNDKMYKYYGENGQLRKLVNYQKDQTINERGYELKERKLYRVY